MKLCNELVSQTCSRFKDDINNLFKNRIIDVVIYGSAKRGDFIEGKSDIDFLAFVDGEITPSDIEDIKVYHRTLRESSNLLLEYIEGRYVSLDKESNIINGYYVGTDEKGWKEINEIGYGPVESAMILDSCIEIEQSGILESILKVEWDKIEDEIICTINSFINNPVNNIGWISFALMVAIRSFYTIEEVGFISKRGAIDWIRKNPKYSKYTRINNHLYTYTDHISFEDKKNMRSTDFVHYKTYLIQIRNDIDKILSCN